MKRFCLLLFLMCLCIFNGFSQENIALNKSVVASTLGKGVLPKFLNDGDTATSWMSQNERMEQWVEIDLQDVYDLSRICIDFAGESASSYSVSTSPNERDWTLRQTFRTIEFAHIKSIDMSKTKAVRYVRIDLTTPNTVKGYRIREVQVFGTLAKVNPVVSMTLFPQNECLVTGQEHLRIISFNNSLIQRNDQDSIFNQLALSAGKDAVWIKQTRLGKSLRYHFDEGEWMQSATTHTARSLLKTQPWTHIILQEQSEKPLIDYADFLASVKLWVKAVRKYCPNPDARIILTMNWPFKTSTDFYGDMKRFWDNCTKVAEETGVSLFPIGKGYEAVFTQDGRDALNAMYTDDRHPSVMASYMSACSVLAGLYDINPEGIMYCPKGMTPEDASRMQARAQEALETYKNTCDQTGRIHFTVKVTDQFNRPVKDNQPVKWSVNGGGTIDANGLFTSNKIPGIYTVEATIGKMTAKAAFEIKSAL
jgi:F5/8 type C domain.